VEYAALRRRVADNLSRVQSNITQAAHGHAITLCCVTKYAQDTWIEALLEARATDLAENLLPRAAERFDGLLSKGHRFTRHLVGAQQSRKLKLIPGHFDWLQALDRLSSAEALEAILAEAGSTLEVLAQVNIVREPQKHGFLPEETEQACTEILSRLPHLHLRGLMAIPPWPDAYVSQAEFERSTRACFGQMRALFDRIRASHPDAPQMDTLSLGMSQDYVWAIEEGATMARVGSALFEGLEG
jgi:hypothetical protein